MTEIARVSDYEGLVRALRARRIELGLTHLAVDEIAGLQTGYTGKIECGTKRLGAMSLTCILGALGVDLVAVRRPPKQSNSSDMPETYLETAKKNGRTGGLLRGQRLSRELRRAHARNAARARWSKKREPRTRKSAEDG